MEHKTLPVTGIKTADLPEGMFEGWASTFGNVDHHNDRVMPGAFTKSIASGHTVPLLWMHQSDDPRAYVGDVVQASETAEGLHIRGKFDLDTEFGAAAYRQVKARRVGALSIGYQVKHATKGNDGVNELTDVDLVEVSVVARGANDRALITAAKSVDRREHLREQIARAQLQTKTEGPSMTVHDYDLNNAFDRDVAKASRPEIQRTAAQADQFTKGRDEQLAAARQIVELARELGRDLTDDEAEKVQKHLDAAAAASKKIDDAARSKSILAQLDAMATDDEPFVGVGGSPGRAGEGKRLSFKGMAAGVATKMLVGDGFATKALAPSGATVVGQEFADDPVALGRIATGLLDVLPVKVHGSPEFSYMRQTTRTNNAAVVAEGAVKPTSVLSVTRVEASLAVIAHLSEGIPRFWLLDVDALQQFIDTELRYGLGVAVEAKVVADINATSGVQTQAYSTSVLQTLRKSITKLEANGYPAGSIVLHPNDWEGVELALASTNAVEHMSLPYDPASRRLFGVPVVTTVSEAAGTSHVLAQGAVTLDTDSQGIGVQWSENATADSFSKNLIFARCEGRFATSVYSPLGVVIADLTA